MPGASPARATASDTLAVLDAGRFQAESTGIPRARGAPCIPRAGRRTPRRRCVEQRQQRRRQQRGSLVLVASRRCDRHESGPSWTERWQSSVAQASSVEPALGAAASIAANTRLNSAPSATVVPIALSTGAVAKPSKPNPITVDALHRAVEVIGALGIARREVAAFEEQRVVRAHPDHQQHAHQVKQREPTPGKRQNGCGDQQRRRQRHQHIPGAPQRAQAREQDQHDGAGAHQREAHHLIAIAAVQRLRFLLQVEQVHGRRVPSPRSDAATAPASVTPRNGSTATQPSWRWVSSASSLSCRPVPARSAGRTSGGLAGLRHVLQERLEQPGAKGQAAGSLGDASRQRRRVRQRALALRLRRRAGQNERRRLESRQGARIAQFAPAPRRSAQPSPAPPARAPRTARPGNGCPVHRDRCAVARPAAWRPPAQGSGLRVDRPRARHRARRASPQPVPLRSAALRAAWSVTRNAASSMRPSPVSGARLIAREVTARAAPGESPRRPPADPRSRTNRAARVPESPTAAARRSRRPRSPRPA